MGRVGIVMVLILFLRKLYHWRKKIAQALFKDIDIEMVIPTVNGEIAPYDYEETWEVNIVHMGEDE